MKGHNKGKDKEENSTAKDTNVQGQNRHLKGSKQKDSPHQGRSKDEDKSNGKKGSNSI